MRKARPRRDAATRPVSGAASPVRIGQVLRLDIEDMAFGEDAVARHEGYVIFVPRVLAGETVEARVVQAGRKFGRAEAMRVLVPSPARVTPRCRHFDSCGGCSWQHLRYDAQTRTKEELLRRLLEGRASAAAASTLVPIAVPGEPWGFREKVQMAVAGKAGAPRVGFYKRRSHDVVDVRECPVQPPEAVARVARIREVLARHRVAPRDGKQGRGGLRHVVLRQGRGTGDAHLVLVGDGHGPAGLPAAVREIEGIRPPLSGASWNRNDADTSEVLGSETRPMFGRSVWVERIAGVELEVSPTAFFQTNSRAAEVLVEEVRRAVPAERSLRVLDLYAGVGLFALTLASRVGEVVAVEAHEVAARDGERNAVRNRIHNCSWRIGSVERLVADPSLGRFGAVVADPPREGLAPGVLEGIVAGCRPRILVLVSCDPMTLARDLVRAEALGGRVVRVLPVDMFPHTHHLEAVATVEFGAAGKKARATNRAAAGPRRPGRAVPPAR